MSKHKLNLATFDTPQQQHPIKKAKPNPPTATAAQQQQQPTWMSSANLSDMQDPLAAPFDMFGSNTINMSISNDTADWLTSPQKPPTTTTQPPQPSSSTSLGALKPQTPFTKVAGNKQPQLQQPQQQPQSHQPIKSTPAPFSSNNINPYPQQQQQQFQQTNSFQQQYRPPPQQHQEQQQQPSQQQLNGNQLDVLSLPLKDVEQQIENERARLADLICARSQLLQTREALLSQLQDVYRMD